MLQLFAAYVLFTIAPYSKTNKVEYLVLWKGYPMSEATWEPEYNINADLIIKFEKNLTSSPVRSPKRSKSRSRSKSKKLE